MKVEVYCYEKCSTCKKAMKWLEDHGIPYRSIDIKGDHPDEKTLPVLTGFQEKAWAEVLGHA